MTTRSTRLAAKRSTAAGSLLLWSCPTGYVTLVKSAYFVNSHASTANYQMFMQNQTGSVGIVVSSGQLATSVSSFWSGWFVLEAGDAVYMYSDQADMQVWLSGAVLPAGPLGVGFGELEATPQAGPPPWVGHPPFKVPPDPQYIIQSG